MADNVIQGVFETEVKIEQARTIAVLKDFVWLPWKIYKDYRPWSPGLISKDFSRLSKRKNPFFEHSDAAFFVAYQKGVPVGRIAAIHNSRHEAIYHDRLGFFGFFECIPNYFIAKRLFVEAEKWCHFRGKTSLAGPVNLSIHEEYGLLISGFDKEPFVFTPYNPPYYLSFMERHGFKKKNDLFAYQINLKNQRKLIDELDEYVKCFDPHPKLTFPGIKLNSMVAYLRRFFKEVFNMEWQQQYGYVPLSDAELEFRFKEYTQWIVPDLLLVGEYKGELVGCMIVLPNFNEVLYRFNGLLSPLNNLLLTYHKKNIKSAKCVLLLVKDRFRNFGFQLGFIREALERLEKRGYWTLEFGWVSEDHIATRHSIERFGLKPIKTYRLFTKEISHVHNLSRQGVATSNVFDLQDHVTS